MSFRSLTQVVDVGGVHEFELRLPADAAALRQDEEWFEIRRDGRWVQLRVHDYAELFADQGLYEALVYEMPECRSPGRVAALLKNTLADVGCEGEPLCEPDLGAGNGVVAEDLRTHGVQHIVGVDILDFAPDPAECESTRVEAEASRAGRRESSWRRDGVAASLDHLVARPA